MASQARGVDGTRLPNLSSRKERHHGRHRRKILYQAQPCRTVQLPDAGRPRWISGGRGSHPSSSPSTAAPISNGELADVGNGFFTIVSLATGRALDIPGGVPTALVAVQQFRLHGGTNQQWRFVTTPAVTGPSLFPARDPPDHQPGHRDGPGCPERLAGLRHHHPAVPTQYWLEPDLDPGAGADQLRSPRSSGSSPSAVNFGTVPVGGTVSRMLTIDNRTGGRVSVTVQRPPSGAFHWDGFSAVLADRDQRGVTVEFSPQTAATRRSSCERPAIWRTAHT